MYTLDVHCTVHHRYGVLVQVLYLGAGGEHPGPPAHPAVRQERGRQDRLRRRGSGRQARPETEGREEGGTEADEERRQGGEGG